MKKNAKMKHIIYSDWEAFDLIDDCLFWEDYKLFNDVSDEELDEMSESEKWQAVYDEMECALDDAQFYLKEIEKKHTFPSTKANVCFLIPQNKSRNLF